MGQWLISTLIQWQEVVSVFERMMAERQHHRNELAKLITKRLMLYINSCEPIPLENEVSCPQQTESQNQKNTVSCNL